MKAAQPLWKWVRLCASHGRRRRSGCVGSHAGVGAAEDFPIKTGKPRAHELIHRREETRLGGTVQRNQPRPHLKEFECMVVTDAPARMSRTEEVHRITENVYKVRGSLRRGHLLHLDAESRQTDRICPLVICSSDSYLPGCLHSCQVMRKKSIELHNWPWKAGKAGGGSPWCRFQLLGPT